MRKNGRVAVGGTDLYYAAFGSGENSSYERTK